MPLILELQSMVIAPVVGLRKLSLKSTLIQNACWLIGKLRPGYAWPFCIAVTILNVAWLCLLGYFYDDVFSWLKRWWLIIMIQWREVEDRGKGMALRAAAVMWIRAHYKKISNRWQTVYDRFNLYHNSMTDSW